MKINSIFFFITLVFLVSLSQLGSAFFASVLPAISRDFHIDLASVQPSVSYFFFGFSFGTLFWGPISEIWGRNKTLIVSLSIYFLSLIGSVFVTSYGLLVFDAAIQGVGLSACSVLAQAVIREFISQEWRIKFFAKMNIVIAFVPAIGVFSGNVISMFSTWRYAFYSLSLMVFIVMCFVCFSIPNSTNTSKVKNLKNLSFECLRKMAKDFDGLRMGFLVGGSMGLMFSYISESSFYFTVANHFSQLAYEIISFGIFLPMLIGALLVRLLNLTAYDFITLGVKIIVYSSLYLLILSVYELSAWFNVIGFYCILMGVSVIIPNCLSKILEKYSNFIGVAASFFGCYYYVVTAVFVAATAFFHKITTNPLLMLFLLSSVIFYFFCNLNPEAIRSVKDSKTH